MAGPVWPRLPAPDADSLGYGIYHLDCRLRLTGLAATIYRNVYHLPISQNLQYSFISYLVGLFGALFGMLLIDRFGRRPCYTVSYLGAGIPLLALWWLSRGALAPVETVVTLASIALFFISILLAGIYVYLPEIYPTRMRALGSGTASAWLRVA